MAAERTHFILRACGDTAVSVDFGEGLDPELTARVRALDAALAENPIPGVVETVPTYRTLAVHVDPLVVDMPGLRARLQDLAQHPARTGKPARIWQVPVVFGKEFGIDLDHVAASAGMAVPDLVAAFVAPEYTVAMVGFLPGFSYLSGLDPRLATPRRHEPRQRIPASSVSIGGAQAAVGTVEGPSGWHLIGRTPVRPFMLRRDPVFLFRSGDRLRFMPVAASQWATLDKQAAAGALVATRVQR